MTRKLRIDGIEFDPAQLSPELRAKVKLILFADARLKELANTKALMVRARQSYIDSLQREIIRSRSGVDFSTLLSD